MRIEIHKDDDGVETLETPDIGAERLAEALCDFEGWVRCEGCGRLLEDNRNPPLNVVHLDHGKFCRACAAGKLATAEEENQEDDEQDDEGAGA